MEARENLTNIPVTASPRFRRSNTPCELSQSSATVPDWQLIPMAMAAPAGCILEQLVYNAKKGDARRRNPLQVPESV